MTTEAGSNTPLLLRQSNSVFESPSEQERAVNLNFAKRIKHQLELETKGDRKLQGVAFLNPALSELAVGFYSYTKNPRRLFRNVAEKFSLPIYVASFNTMQTIFRDNSGKLYCAQKQYLFNEKGQGTICVTVKNGANLGIKEPSSANFDKTFPIKQIDTPKFNLLQTNDYQGMGRWLVNIEAGTCIKRVVRTK